MSIATIVTRGYGSFGTIPEVVLRGYTPAEVFYETVPIGWDLCARCGCQYPERKLRKEWTGFKVCHGPSTNDCWDPRHPQLSVRAVPERPLRPGARPEPADVFLSVNEVTADSL